MRKSFVTVPAIVSVLALGVAPFVVAACGPDKPAQAPTPDPSLDNSASSSASPPPEQQREAAGGEPDQRRREEGDGGARGG
jgi:hypothetical protein